MNYQLLFSESPDGTQISLNKGGNKYYIMATQQNASSGAVWFDRLDYAKYAYKSFIADMIDGIGTFDQRIRALKAEAQRYE